MGAFDLEFGNSQTALQFSFSFESRELATSPRLEQAEAGSRRFSCLENGLMRRGIDDGLPPVAPINFSLSLSLTFIVTVSSLLAHLSILAMLFRLMPIERLRSQR